MTTTRIQDPPTTRDDPAARTGPLSEDEKIVHLLNRLTPGATAALVEEVRLRGWKPWLEEQLRGRIQESDALTSRISAYETLSLDGRTLFRDYNANPPDELPEVEKRKMREKAQIPLRELLSWILYRAVYSSRPVREVSCDFFRNHFSVDLEKDDLRYVTMGWERDVILHHSLRTFGQMLEATAHHAAMLLYLDNHLSRRPPTPSELRIIEGETRRVNKSKDKIREAVDIAKQRGLNENYGRELLELHTLGVDRFYTQDDVTNVALALTGWTINRKEDRRFAFDFNVEMHSTDLKRFLGVPLKGRRDTGEGDFILEVLRKHKGTALFLSWKLCRWLVNDEPDEEMVKRVAKVFLSTDGDVPSVFLAIAEDKAFFERRNFRAKFKRPWEFVVSALRATGAELTSAEGALRAAEEMNESLYRCPDPTGYYDQAEAWRDPGALAVRWTFASRLATGRLPGAKIPASLFADLPAGEPRRWIGLLAARILPVAGLEPATSANLERLLDAELKRNPNPSPAQVGPQIVAVLLGSPEFQKQ